MGLRVGRAVLVATALLGASARAHAGSDEPAWVLRAEALADRIADDRSFQTAQTDRAYAERARTLQGAERLLILYDLAAEAYSDGDRDLAVARRLDLEREAAAQGDEKFGQMAAALRAYEPSLDGDSASAVAALTEQMATVTDPEVRAVVARFLSFLQTARGLFTKAVEAARAGLVDLPDTPETLILRAGLHDALAYDAVSVGDYENVVQQLEIILELDRRAGRASDGLGVLHNLTWVLSLADQSAAAQHLMHIHQELSARYAPEASFYALALCAQVEYRAERYAASVDCAGRALAIPGHPVEYVPPVLIARVRSLARLGRPVEAREGLTALEAIAATRNNPALVARVEGIAADVLFAEGRAAEAFASLRAHEEKAERTRLEQFSAGIREVRANLQNQIAEAEAKATEAAMRAELHERAVRNMRLTVGVAVLTLVGLAAIVILVVRSRAQMLSAVGRAERILRRGGEARGALGTAGSAVDRLGAVLDAIERHDGELRQAFAAVQLAKAEAEQADRAKSQFLATMSHELRTPLNAIIGYGELLLEKAAERRDPEDRADLERVLAAAARLLVLIQGVLDLSRLTSGSVAPVAGPVDFGRMLAEAADTVRPTIRANGNELVVQAADLGLGETDGFKLGQCLLNLLANAAKFTHRGTIRVEARRIEDPRGALVLFRVSDTGVGIPPDVRDRLFQPFVQADASPTRTHGGVGLGLAITRQLARVLGGDVSVESAPGVGSTFTLTVPVALPATERLAA